MSETKENTYRAEYSCVVPRKTRAGGSIKKTYRVTEDFKADSEAKAEKAAKAALSSIESRYENATAKYVGIELLTAAEDEETTQAEE